MIYYIYLSLIFIISKFDVVQPLVFRLGGFGDNRFFNELVESFNVGLRLNG